MTLIPDILSGNLRSRFASKVMHGGISLEQRVCKKAPKSGVT